MEIVQGTTDFQLYRETAVAIGKFDGVHIGHRRLLEEILARKAEGLQACVFTFDPPPMVFFGRSDGKELTTRWEKRTIFEHMGVDILIEFPLNARTAAIPPADFVRGVLADRMQTGFIAAGEDLSFGAGGAGEIGLLRSLADECGFTVKTIPKVCVGEKVVSSTLVRGLVESGRMEEAEQMLGKPYSVQGKVIRGNGVGREWGVPTVNLLPPEEKLMPEKGVYYSKVRCDGQIYRAISNVGYKPTVAEDKVLGIESYLYDFDREIYDESVEVELLSFRRPERKFENLDALKRQLREDVEAGREF